MVYTREEIMLFEEYTSFEHSTALGNALSQTVQLILKQMRFIGQKLFRLLILSDGSNQVSRINPINIAKIAMQFGDSDRCHSIRSRNNSWEFIEKTAGYDPWGTYLYFRSERIGCCHYEIIEKEKKHSTVFDKKDDSGRIGNSRYAGRNPRYSTKIRTIKPKNRKTRLFII